MNFMTKVAFILSWITHSNDLVKQLFRNTSSVWNTKPRHICSQILSFDFFLMLNYDVCKIPLKWSAFYREAFLCTNRLHLTNTWSETTRTFHGNSSHSSQNIALEILIFVYQLFNNQSWLLTYEELLSRCDLPVPPLEYHHVSSE